MKTPTAPAHAFLISAEHASNAVPTRWKRLFAEHTGLLESHRAWDPGSLEMAQALAAALDAPLLKGQITRLLIDLNRSARDPRRFSEFSRALPADERDLLHRYYWQPHWQRYREYLDCLPGRIVHIACHSFTPALEDKTRTTDIGLLYDPARALEAEWCRALGRRLRAALPGLQIHMNRPYRGVSNGMGQQHRRHYPDSRLMTLEIELNQRLQGRAHELSASIARAIRKAP